MEVLTTYSGPQNTTGNSSHAVAPAAKIASGQGPDIAHASAPGQYRAHNSEALQRALQNSNLPELADGSARVELNFSQDTGRVIAKVTDRTSGEILREIPSKELQQLFAQMREYLGSFVDEEI